MSGEITLEKQYSWLSWVGWFVASFAGLCQFLLQTYPSVMINDLANTFSTNAFGVSILASSFFYTYIPCQIPAGILIDYFKPRRTIFFAEVMLALLCVAFATSTVINNAFISRMLMGIFAAPIIISALYLAARTLPPRYFTLMAGFTETLGMLGGVVGEALLARSVLHFGWQQTLFILAGVACIMAFAALIFIRDDAREDAKLANVNVKSRPNHLLRDLWTMLQLPEAWINGLFCGIAFSVIAAFGAFWCIPFLMATYGLSLKNAADASSMIFIGAALGAPILGWMSDRFHIRRLFMFTYMLALLITFLIVMYIPLSFSHLFFILFLLGFFASVYLLPFTIIRDITPMHMRGTALGYINMMCILIGSPLIQPLIGYLLHHSKAAPFIAYQQALLVFPISFVIGLSLVIFIREQ